MSVATVREEARRLVDQLPDDATQPITGSCPSPSLCFVRIPLQSKAPYPDPKIKFRYWLMLINKSRRT